MSEQIKLFSSDLDGTLLGKPDATLAFHHTWNKLRETSDPSPAPVLVYNSGRLLPHTLEVMKASHLPDPDYLICGVGTIIFDYKKREYIKVFADTLNTGWDRELVQHVMHSFSNIEEQPKKYQNKFKSSWYIHDAPPERIEEIRKALEDEGLSVNVIYSSSRDLDILPQYANKGNALNWLLHWLGISPSESLVAGDTGNDNSMFQIRTIKGIIVENAQPELFLETIEKPTYSATKPFADGVLEGLMNFGVISKIEDVSSEELSHKNFDPQLHNLVRS